MCIRDRLKLIDNNLWQFLRLRPVNFPTIRIAQLANLILKIKGRFDELLKIDNNDSLLHTLNISTSDYWLNHYHFGKESTKRTTKSLGIQSKLRIIHNTIIPYLFIYAAKHNNQEQKEKIIDYLYRQPAEQNKIIDEWKTAGLKVTNEAKAQALIYLTNSYCHHKKCLNCHIGHAVLCKT
jgi:hypothetical protein